MRLSEILGQESLAREILARATVPGSRCWLAGPSGSGKTETAGLVAESWPGRVVWVWGCKGATGASHWAAHRALEGSRPPRAVRDLTRAEGLDFMRDIPIVGNTLAMLAKQAVARGGPNGPDFLTPDQQDLLCGFQQLCGGSASMFIIDDANWLDDSSAQLFWLMQMDEISSAYSFVRSASFLFLETTDREATVRAEVWNDLKSSAISGFATRFPPRDVFHRVLRCMGLRQALPGRTVDGLYDVTRGHLKLAREIVRMIQQGSVEVTEVVSKRDGEIERLAAKLLQIRLVGLDSSSGRLERLLATAACAGHHFSYQELECAFDEPEVFTSALELARQEEYLIGEAETLRFAHDIVQSAILCLDSPRHTEYHDKLAECIRQLTPGEYAKRFHHSKLAGNRERTAALSFAVLLQMARGDRASAPPESVLEKELGELRPTLDSARAALSAMDDGKPADAIRALAPRYRGDDNLVQAELAYLLALNYYKCRSIAGYEGARSILEVWKTRRSEGEAWYRLMITLAVVYAALGDRGECSQILQRVRIFLDTAARTDPTARLKIQVLNRKAEIFFPIEIASSLIRQAVEYFGPPPGMMMPRNAFQYTAALVNLSGNLYVLGEFGSSADAAERGISYIPTLSGRFRIAEPYKAFNNYAIAAFRAGILPADSARGILSAVGEPADKARGVDRSLLVINKAVLSALAGDVATSDEILAATLKHLGDTGADGYYLVFAASNLAAVRYLKGQASESLILLDEAETHLAAISQEIRRCHHLRLELMRKIIREQSISDPQVLDDSIRSACPDGPHVAWKSIGWGFTMSDIQVWSES